VCEVKIEAPITMPSIRKIVVGAEVANQEASWSVGDQL
jgi:hypothetical protein